MSRTVFDSLIVVALAAALPVVLGGCGLTQRVADSTAETTRAIFYTPIKTLQLNFSARPALNTDGQDMQGLSLPTLVRVYQLRDDKTVLRADYDRLVGKASDRLNTDVLDEHALVILPEQGAQLDVALHKDARFIAVVGLFRQPEADHWRLLLPRDALDPERPRVIELLDNRLALRPLEAG